MASYQKARFKLTNTQLNKLKSVVKYKTGTTLGLNEKNFKDEDLPHEFFPTARQKNAFTSNMSTDNLVKPKCLK